MKKIDRFLEFFDGKTIHIIGMSGAEGSTMARFFLQHGYYNIIGHDFVDQDQSWDQFSHAHDWMSEEEKRKVYNDLFQSGISVRFRNEYLSGIGEEDILCVPQSWFRYSFNDPLYRFFDADHYPKKEHKERIFSLTQLYLNLFPGVTVGITGSNGKSTTTALIAHILAHACEKEGKNRKLFWGGNDRKNDQPLFKIHEAKRNDILVLEISNRQLSFAMRVSPNIAVITNIVPNHIDDHRTFDNYIETKKEILRYQKKSDIAVLNYDNNITRDAASLEKVQTFFFSMKEEVTQGAFLKGDTICYKDERGVFDIVNISRVLLKGQHNIENILAACTVCFSVGIDEATIAESVSSFAELPYRIEYVDTINGVAYYDDSSGCNPKNTSAAMNTFDSPLIVIAGGSRKNPLPEEFREWVDAVNLPHVKKIILIGSVKDFIFNVLGEGNVPFEKIQREENLKTAVQYAHSLSQSGDTVVLAPGCESFGEFQDYRERGDQFKLFVKELKYKGGLESSPS